MATILVNYGVPPEGFRILKEAGHQILMPPSLEEYPREELLRLLPACDALVAAKAVDAEMIRTATRLKLIANYGAGYDSVDIAAAAARGIPVTNIPETVTEATAELAFGLMLAVCRRIGELNTHLREEPPETIFGLGRNMGRSLRGMTLGIIGAGRIGSRMAEMARAFGMRVIGYSRRGADPSVMEPVSLEEVLTRSDVVSLHCPLTPETRGLMDRERIAMMKPGAVLINTARGPVVDEDALCEALESGRLSGAGLDVYADEPHISPRILALKQAVLMPHMGTNTLQTRDIMAEACSRQILDLLAGRRPEHIVNGV